MLVEIVRRTDFPKLPVRASRDIWCGAESELPTEQGLDEYRRNLEWFDYWLKGIATDRMLFFETGIRHQLLTPDRSPSGSSRLSA